MFTEALTELIDGRARLEEPLVLVFMSTSPLTTMVSVEVEVEANADGRVRRLLRGGEGLTRGGIVMAWLEEGREAGPGEDDDDQGVSSRL